MNDLVKVLSLRNELISELLNISDAVFLLQIKEFIKKSKETSSSGDAVNQSVMPESLSLRVKSIRKKTDLDVIIKAQNFQGIDRDVFESMVQDLNIQEPLNDLCKQV